MESIVSFMNSILWGPWFIYGILLIGLFFSIITRFLQIRHIKDMFVLMFKGEKSEKGISSFQAMSIALSGRVGTGNIAGTATAIAMGETWCDFLDVGNCLHRCSDSLCGVNISANI
ncbi:hypothetical protein LSPH26S_04861 [Lysinibacillus sphaericus]